MREGREAKEKKKTFTGWQYILWAITAQKTMYFATMKTYIAEKLVRY